MGLRSTMCNAYRRTMYLEGLDLIIVHVDVNELILMRISGCVSSFMGDRIAKQHHQLGIQGCF
jgi:hypothetical protein